MRIQIVLLAFCAVAHGAPNDQGGGLSAHGPFADYGAPAPPSPFPPAPPSHSSFPPGPPAPVKPPSPGPSSGDWAPAPALAPAQPPAHQAPSGFYAPPAKPEAPAFKPPQFTPSQPFTPSQLAPAAPFQFYGGLAPAPAPHHPPAPAPAPAPVPVPAPAPSPVQQPAASYGGPSDGQESAESSEESTGLTNELVNLSSAKTLKGKTLSDGRIQSLLSEQVHSHDSGGSAHAETSVSGGYSFNEPPKSCQAGETRNKNGACEKVQSSTNYYLFDVPGAPKQPLPSPQTPEKRVHYNVLLVRVPTESQQVQNINLSKDEQKTLVYVVRDPPKESPKLPAPVTEAYKPHAPAVFYVTPEKKHTSAEKKEPIGYGIVAQEKPLPSPPSPSHGYSSGW